MTALAPFVLALAGFVALALAMQRHHRALFGRAPGRGTTAALRIAGAGGLAAALWVCVESWGWAIGSVAWFGVLSAAALAVVLLLALAGRRDGRKTG